MQLSWVYPVINQPAKICLALSTVISTFQHFLFHFHLKIVTLLLASLHAVRVVTCKLLLKSFLRFYYSLPTQPGIANVVPDLV